jgi:lipopolysaccharide biosynthesis regulator YciM
MEFQTWWLLAVPLFFGLGWFAARLDARQAARPAGGLPDAYFRGLNFLLNEQPDKAIDAFLDGVRLDPETIELHFALGSLFRRRGETDRAIRVHQNLAERPGLGEAQREHALFELGQDFLRAGLLDRAEDAFNRLAGSGYAAAALRHRLSIAQMVRDWRQAIELAQRLRQDAGDAGGGLSREIAQFHCELATQTLAGQSPDRLAVAGREIAAALLADPDHPRPLLLRGELALAEGDAAGAITHWALLLRRHPAHAALVARGWLQAHLELGRPAEALPALSVAHQEQPGADTLTALADAIQQEQGAAAALAWVEAELRVRPSLPGLEKLLVLRKALGAGAADSDTDLIQRLLAPQAGQALRHVCSHCGFKARQFYWQCPGCSRWDTYPPRRGQAAEGAR